MARKYQNFPPTNNQQPQAGTLIIDPALKSLNKLYFFRNIAEIENFLTVNPFLIPLLEEVPNQIAKYFPGTDLALEVSTSREKGEETQLVIFIITALDYKLAGEKLNQLDEEWWLNALDTTNDKLTLNLEFR